MLSVHAEGNRISWGGPLGAKTSPVKERPDAAKLAVFLHVIDSSGKNTKDVMCTARKDQITDASLQSSVEASKSRRRDETRGDERFS